MAISMTTKELNNIKLRQKKRKQEFEKLKQTNMKKAKGVAFRRLKMAHILDSDGNIDKRYIQR